MIGRRTGRGGGTGIYAFIDYRNNGQYIQSTDDAM
jgi:hypothetical protein